MTQDDQDSIDTIHYAIESGINWIDTSAAYGLGHSETIVGQAVKGIQNQCSLVWDDNRIMTASLKSDSLRKEVEASLRRTG